LQFPSQEEGARGPAPSERRCGGGACAEALKAIWPKDPLERPVRIRQGWLSFLSLPLSQSKKRGKKRICWICPGSF
jgi:hypothetical protein